jgi:hypothetical protein
MNRNERRTMFYRAKKRISKAKAWVLVTFDGKTAPIYSFDVESLQDKQDIRHHAMRKIANHSAETCQKVMDFREKQINEFEEKQKVAAAKEKRSKDLQESIDETIVGGRTFQQEEVKVA